MDSKTPQITLHPDVYKTERLWAAETDLIAVAYAPERRKKRGQEEEEEDEIGVAEDRVFGAVITPPEL